MDGGQIGSAFIRIRPDLTGFKAETQAGVQSAFLGVGKILAAGLAVGAVTDVVKKVAVAAAEEQTAIAKVKTAVKDVNAAWVIHGATVTNILNKQSRTLGFSVSDLSGAFTKIVTSTKNTATALKLMTEAENLARARGIDLGTAAILVTKVHDGLVSSLTRYGIVLPKITTQETALKKIRDNAISQGGKFTAQQKLIYDQALASAKLADQRATKVVAEQALQQRYQGQATAFSKTAAGQFANFQQNLLQLEVSIGQQLLPALTAGIVQLNRWVDELRTSTTVHQDVATAVMAVKNAISGVESGMRAILPVATQFYNVLRPIVQFAGAGGILSFVAGVKGAQLVIAGASAATSKWNQILQLGGVKTATATTDAQTGSVVGLTGALQQGADATASAVAAQNASIAAYAGATAEIDNQTASLAALVTQAGRATDVERLLGSQVAQLGAVAESPVAGLGAQVGELQAVSAEAGGAAAAYERLRLAEGSAAIGGVGIGGGAAIADTGALSNELILLTAAAETASAATTGAGTAAGAAGVDFSGLAQNAGDSAAVHERLASSLERSRAVLGGVAVESVASAGAAREHAQAEDGRGISVGAATAALQRESAELAANGDATLANAAAQAKLAVALGATAEASAGTVAGLAAQKEAQLAARGAVLLNTAGTVENTVAQDTSRLTLGKVGAGLFQLAGGWSTVATVGLGAAAFGIYKLITAESSWTRANKDLANSLAGLNSQIDQTKTDAQALKDAISQIPTDKLSIKTAQLGVAQEKQNLVQALGIKGTALGSKVMGENVKQLEKFASGIQNSSKFTLAQREAANGTLQALLTLKGAQQKLTGDRTAIGAATLKHTQDERLLGAAYDDQSKKLGNLAELAKKFVPQGSTVGGAKGAGINVRPTAEQIRAGTQKANEEFVKAVKGQETKLVDSLTHQGKTISPLLAHNLDLVVAYANALKGKSAVSGDEIAKIFKNRSLTVTEQDILRTTGLPGLANKVRAQARHEVGEPFAHGIVQGINDRKPQVIDAITALGISMTKAAKAALGISSPSKVAREQIGQAISEGVALGILDKNGAVVTALTSQVDQAITDGVQQVQDSIIQAKQNLNSIGSSLAGDIGGFLDKSGNQGALAASGPAAARLKALNKQLASGATGPALVRAAAALQNQIAAQQAAAAAQGTQADKIKTHLANLTDLFNKHVISLKQFHRDVDGVLKGAGITAGRIQKKQGVAAADQFRADLKGIFQQAVAIRQSPNFGGSALAPTIIRPLDQIKQVQQNIYSAQQAQTKQLTAITKHTKKTADAAHAGAVASAAIKAILAHSLGDNHPNPSSAKKLGAKNVTHR